MKLCCGGLLIFRLTARVSIVEEGRRWSKQSHAKERYAAVTMQDALGRKEEMKGGKDLAGVVDGISKS
jgi:hypothetical protein